MNVMAEIQRRNYLLCLSVPKEKSRAEPCGSAENTETSFGVFNLKKGLEQPKPLHRARCQAVI